MGLPCWLCQHGVEQQGARMVLAVSSPNPISSMPTRTLDRLNHHIDFYSKFGMKITKIEIKPIQNCHRFAKVGTYLSAVSCS